MTKFTLVYTPDEGDPRVETYPTRTALTRRLRQLLWGPEYVDGPFTFHGENGTYKLNTPLNAVCRLNWRRLTVRWLVPLDYHKGRRRLTCSST